MSSMHDIISSLFVITHYIPYFCDTPLRRGKIANTRSNFKSLIVKSNLLLPHCSMKIGRWTFIPFLMLCIAKLSDHELVFEFSVPVLINSTGEWFSMSKDENLYGEFWMIGFFLSLLFMALSKEKTEDEMLLPIRLHAMLFALWITSALFVFITLFIFSVDYAYCLWAILYTFLGIFILNFRYKLYKLKQTEK